MKSLFLIFTILLFLTGCTEAFPENCIEEGYSGVVILKDDPKMHGDCSNGDTFTLFNEEMYHTKNGSCGKKYHIYYTNEEYQNLIKNK